MGTAKLLVPLSHRRENIVNAYLLGGGVGAIGLLGGVAYGLWMRVKFERMKGKLNELTLKHTHELEAHGRTLDAALADAEKYERDREAAEEIAARYKKRLEKVRARELEHTTDDDLLAIANDQPGLRLLDSKEAEETRAGDDHQDGDDS